MTKTAKQELAPGVEATKAEIAEAKKEGALDAVKEGAKRAVAVDTGTTADPDDAGKAEEMRVAPDFNSTPVAPLLDLPLDALVKRMTNDKMPDPIDFETVKGLLALERSGRNRTDYVKAFCGRLGVKSPYEVTNAGPGYTNDTTNVTEIAR